jgi:hypothetical protein
MDKTPLRIVEATESDVPETMDLQFATCDGGPFRLAIWGPNTRDSRKRVNQRVLTKWRNDPFLHITKCIEDIPVAGDAATTTTALSKSTILSLGYLRQNAPQQNGWPRTSCRRATGWRVRRGKWSGPISCRLSRGDEIECKVSHTAC